MKNNKIVKIILTAILVALILVSVVLYCVDIMLSILY